MTSGWTRVLFVMRAVVGAWVLVLVGCGGEASSGGGAGGSATPADAGPGNGVDEDADDDGLCDVTEATFGTDRRLSDTDEDGVVDLVEVAYDLGELDPVLPPPERVVVLEARPGASIAFAVRVTVSGDGAGQTGAFEAEGTVYDEAQTAADYFAGASAVSAEPTENVRGIDTDAERFASVFGETRLAFELRFEHPVIDDIPSCVRGYPFRYTVKSSLGDVGNLVRYLLVVVPEDASVKDGPWCGLDPCL